MTDRDWNFFINMKENDRGGNDKAPDYKGSFTLENKEYNFALWPAKSGNGYSGKIQPREVKKQEEETESGDIPF